jgi:RNA polymerase sigma-70 factor (ECF subfamily)
MDPDLELFERWRAGDASAGQELFQRHFASLYAFFKHKTDRRSAISPDDLVQQTFLQCVRAREQFQRVASFRTYLFAIARNELYQYFRKLPRCEHLDLEASSLNEVISSPSQKLHRDQEKHRLIRALGALPIEQQVLLELHYWHELDAAALAEVFDAQPGAIRVRLHRARLELRELLERDALEDASADALSRSLREPDLDPIGA